MTAADPKSVWVVQAWAFGASYWTNERLEAYLSGVSNSCAARHVLSSSSFASLCSESDNDDEAKGRLIGRHEVTVKELN